ncbi:PREDICTED: pre T-cell antigen receptor alpha [Propithecus coquereli]|uniref:pre T-cell antigen receptor alpha n=1 Tax=Propithecus coquereli TaxID=379532 RepID=UPI00063F6D69|nr:PREDICTED: pre T-cell antigen receptor alpha [Propithecus coquereli]
MSGCEPDQRVGSTPFPSLAPPITLLVDGKQQMLVVCLVLDVAPPGLHSPIWFSAGNGSALDAFNYGPSPATDGTWTSLAQLSLPSEELAAWEPLVCHTGPGRHSRSTQPLQLSGEASTARTCPKKPLRGMPGQALRLGALRVLLFKLLLFDVLLTCSRLRACPPPSPAVAASLRALGPHRLRPAAVIEGREAASSPSPLWALQPRGRCGDHARPGRQPRSSVWQEGTFSTSRAWGWCS